MKNFTIFLKWLNDRLNKHQYWYKEPPKFWNTDAWGKAHRVPNTPLVVKTLGNAVTKKKCKVCNILVYSNNNESICGRLSCWLRKDTVS